MMKSGKATERTVVNTGNRLAQEKNYVELNYIVGACLRWDITVHNTKIN